MTDIQIESDSSEIERLRAETDELIIENARYRKLLGVFANWPVCEIGKRCAASIFCLPQYFDEAREILGLPARPDPKVKSDE